MNMDENTAALHRKIYFEMLDELDKDIIQEILTEPEGEAALLLNKKVQEELEKQISVNSNSI